MDYYMPSYYGLIMMAIGTVALPVHLTGYRERGVLRRFRASSFSVWAVLGSQLLVSFIIAIVGSILVTILGKVAYDPHWPVNPGLLAVAFVLGTVCFTCFGLFLGAVLPSTRSAQGVGMLLFFIMMILGGAGPPPEVMSGAMQFIGEITPLHWVIYMLQDPWLGFGWHTNASLIVAGITVVSAGLARGSSAGNKLTVIASPSRCNREAKQSHCVTKREKLPLLIMPLRLGAAVKR